MAEINRCHDNNMKILLFPLRRCRRQLLGAGIRRNRSLSHKHSFLLDQPRRPVNKHINYQQQ